MIYTIEKNKILELLINQLDNYFILDDKEKKLLSNVYDNALLRSEKCFKGIKNKYWNPLEGDIKFNPFHSVQYMIFLYFVANELFKENGGELCDKVYYLNKVMNGVDLFYAIELPEVWGAEHPIGSVLGRAKYEDGFFFYQGCTVGGNRGKDGVLHYPVIGRNFKMFANSSLIGDCHIGDNVILGAGALVKDQSIQSNSIVFGQSPSLIIKENKHR